jgi:hypothetical protein
VAKKPKVKGKGTCHICRKLTLMIDEHHVWPQAAGGENGPTVDLCSSCHSGIHRAALNLLSKKATRKEFFTPDEMTRAAPLIRWLVIAIQQASEKRGPESKSKLVIEIDTQLLKLLHLCKLDAGHTNLSVFCASVLQDYVKSKL